MGRVSKKDYLKKNKDILTKEFKAYGKRILSIVDLGLLLKKLSEEYLMHKLTRKEFADILVSINFLEIEKITLPNRKMTKYIFGKVSKYELALSINKDSYLSHYTAVYLYGLIDNIPKTIYTNTEQYKKSPINDGELVQLNVDRAFSRPMRKTNNIAKLNDFDVVLLNGKNTRKLEVLNIAIDGVELPITSLERTLIDIVTRPDYAGGVQEIINAYKGAKGKVSTSRIIATLRKFDYMYPYHQAIGFYLERAGYDEKVLARFDKLDKKCDFYLTYQMKDKNYSNRWKVYYPAYLD
ncbi:MAG: hypothetical protein N4A62_06815 [Marinisporobacter sp.]|jgi:hypothetical protein|nr:hypothetical protein [Marinisporobacter sp.]MCV6599654.1 hypothetical protein [Alphaproteobacteria bacterium]